MVKPLVLTDAVLYRWWFYSAPELELDRPPQKIDGDLADLLARLGEQFGLQVPKIAKVSRDPAVTDRVWSSRGWRGLNSTTTSTPSQQDDLVQEAEVRNLYDADFARVGIQLNRKASVAPLHYGNAFELFDARARKLAGSPKPDLAHGTCFLAQLDQLPTPSDALDFAGNMLGAHVPHAPLHCVPVDAGLLCFGDSPFVVVLFHDASHRDVAVSDLVVQFLPEWMLAQGKRIRKSEGYVKHKDALREAESRLVNQFPRAATQHASLEELEQNATQFSSDLTRFTLLLSRQREILQTLRTNLQNIQRFGVSSQVGDPRDRRALEQWLYRAFTRDIDQLESDASYFEAGARTGGRGLEFLQIVATLRGTAESRRLGTEVGKAVGDIAGTQRKLEFVESFVVAVYAVELFHHLGTTFGFSHAYTGCWLLITAVAFGVVTFLLLVVSPGHSHAGERPPDECESERVPNTAGDKPGARRRLGIILVLVLATLMVVFLVLGFARFREQDHTRSDRPIHTEVTESSAPNN